MSDGVSNDESRAYLKQLKQDIETHCRLRGSSLWVERFLDEVSHFHMGKKLGRDGRSGGEGILEYDFKSGLHHFPTTRDTFPFSLDKLQLLPQNSVVARRLIASRMLSLQGLEDLHDGNDVKAVQCIAAALRLDDLPVQWRLSHLEPFTQTLETLAASSKDKEICADVSLVLCHLHSTDRKPEKALSSLRRGQQAAPDDEAIFFTTGNVLNTLGDLEGSAAALERSMTLGNRHEALFIHGCVMQSLGDQFQGERKEYCTQSARKSLKQYILSAPPEERKICEAYFHLAVLEACESNSEEAWQHYRRGEQAKLERLSCFGNETSNYQAAAQTLLKSERCRTRREEQVSRFQGAAAILQQSAGCGNEGCSELGTELCVGCRSIRYCSRQCQKKHWRQHKKACRGVEKK